MLFRSSNTERTSIEVPPLLSLPALAPSSGLTASNVVPPTHLVSLDAFTTPVPPFISPAGRSARQRRKANPSTSSRRGRPRSKPYDRTPERKKKEVPCPIDKCDQTLCDVSAMYRHVLFQHMGYKPKCPGCCNPFSRDDVLKRHLDNSERDGFCRTAAKANGWTEVIDKGKIKLTKPRITRRSKMVAASGILDKNPSDILSEDSFFLSI